ncbi:MAG: DUF4245 domain-containing protein [Lacisediminihabitans sp.]
MTDSPQSGQAPARIVAELGRPETPEETAARKAETSRKHRANQTFLNLAFALAACLAIVLVLVLVAVRPSLNENPSVNYQKLASDAQPTVSETLAAPALPNDWKANSARLDKGSDGITSWYIGLVTPAPQYIGMVQGLRANATWVSVQLHYAKPTGTTTIDGLEWTLYDQRNSTKDPNNFAYSMSTTVGESSFVLHGSAATAEFRTVATALAAQLEAAGDL